MTALIETIQTEFASRMPDVKLRTVRDSLLLGNAADLTRVALYLKEHPVFRMDYLSSVTGADYLSFLEAVYHFYSIEKKQGPVVLRVRVPRTDPRVPSLVPVYRSADLQEREAYDLFGIRFEGHPDLRRIFLWEGFEGHPLRKDYDQEDTEVLETADIAWLDAHRIAVPNAVKEKAKALEAAGKRAVAQRPEKARPG
ncbi:MAG: NADH-quinone oxidoreductase subunit C [Candidatus Omnitrophica bacterium]|nr:NADH-quinone oxidoreductase subunit C [Candidatus Omnitrophota bacterium]